GAELAHVPLDLTSLSSVRAAAEQLAAFRPLHGLVNNAGRVVASRRRLLTDDGFEATVGGNFLGHFALTTLLFPALAEGARVVGMGSDSTRMVRLDPADLWSERRYGAFRAYAFSKHAVQGFHLELARRLAAAEDSRMSLLAHPGWATSAYAQRRPGITDRDPVAGRFFEALTGWVGQGKDRGAWPAVRAITDPDAVNGMYFGPSRMLAGRPCPCELSRHPPTLPSAPPCGPTPSRRPASASRSSRTWRGWSCDRVAGVVSPATESRLQPRPVGRRGRGGERGAQGNGGRRGSREGG